MPLEYSIIYSAENRYDRIVKDAVWQFLIVPEDNENQELISFDFSNSLHIPIQSSINGYGFTTLRLNPKVPFKDIRFKASFTLRKQEVNPFDFIPAQDHMLDFGLIDSLDFKVAFEPFLRITGFTELPEHKGGLFEFNTEQSVFNNLLALNHWVYLHLYFQPGVTHVGTILAEIIKSRKGVCQDFAHLFCALARKNKVPARYVSGYLHQGSGYFGDSQMHAWAEAYVPDAGWIGFDPTNDILAGNSHIKVAHGKDYQDCSPLKGVIFAPGKNRTSHSVEVSARQAQQ